LVPEALRAVSDFDANTHDVEVVPIAAITIEPRKDTAQIEVEEIDATGDAFDIIDTTYRPSPDFLERVLSATGGVRAARSKGESQVYMLLVVEAGRLASPDPHEHALAFGVYVGTTEQQVAARYQQHRDPTALLRASSLNWQGVEPVGVVRLDQRFRGLSREAAADLERDLAEALRRLGLRVLGGH